MVLLDSTIWMDHLRSPNASVSDMLRAREVLTHDAVIGEVLLGSIKNRLAIARGLAELPKIPSASDDDVINLVEEHRLYGSGIGWVDAHLIAACLLDGRAYVWTTDKRMLRVAERLGVDATTA